MQLARADADSKRVGAVCMGPVDDDRHPRSERLRSTGGRPGLGELRRQKIPLSDADWEILITLAEAIADEEIHPTPGQLASQILHRQLTELRDQLRVATKAR